MNFLWENLGSARGKEIKCGFLPDYSLWAFTKDFMEGVRGLLDLILGNICVIYSMKKIAIKRFTYTSLAVLALSGVAISLNSHHSVFAAEDATTAATTTPTSEATDTADAGSAAAADQGAES